MNNIIIGFSRSNSCLAVGSQAIRISEKRDFSHAYIRYTDPTTGIQIVAQASHGFVNEINFDIFKSHNIVCEEYELVCNPEQFVDVLTFVKTHLGTKYSKAQIIFLAIKKIVKFEIKEYNKDKEFICSEFAARVCQIAKVRVPTYLDYFTPSDLNTLIKDINLPRIA